MEDIKNIIERLHKKTSSGANKLAVRILHVIIEENPTCGDAMAAIGLADSFFRYVKSKSRCSDLIMNDDDARYFCKCIGEVNE